MIDSPRFALTSVYQFCSEITGNSAQNCPWSSRWSEARPYLHLCKVENTHLPWSVFNPGKSLSHFRQAGMSWTLWSKREAKPTRKTSAVILQWTPELNWECKGCGRIMPFIPRHSCVLQRAIAAYLTDLNSLKATEERNCSFFLDNKDKELNPVYSQIDRSQQSLPWHLD